MDRPTSVIAFLGTGLMGSRMVRRLLAAGFTVKAWNRDRTKAEALAPHGATVITTAAEALAGADVAITMLANGPAVESVLFGPSGAATAVRSGALVIDMSSAPPDLAREHARRFAAHGIDYLDAPVSGRHRWGRARHAGDHGRWRTRRFCTR